MKFGGSNIEELEQQNPAAILKLYTIIAVLPDETDSRIHFVCDL
jgi:hypothetical protein